MKIIDFFLQKDQNASVRKEVKVVKTQNRKIKSKSVESPSLVPPTSISTSNPISQPIVKDEPKLNLNKIITNKEEEITFKPNNANFTDNNQTEDAMANMNDIVLPILSKVRTIHSPTTPASSIMSTSNSFSWTRERALEQQIDGLRETLKDTEERLQSLRLQYDNVSQMHRKLRDANHYMVEEMDRLKIDAQHLHDCANILRNELQAARKDRTEALEVQAMLQRELDTSRIEKRRVCEESESNQRQILDLQRQCKEMERILARKNPDTMKALIGNKLNNSRFNRSNRSSK